MKERAIIYLAPKCCASEGEGRLWCEDDVWPCSDCPHKLAKVHPRGIRYRLDDDEVQLRAQMQAGEYSVP